MEKKQGFLRKFLVVMIAAFSLTLLSPEVATQLGTMQTVQAAVKISSKSLIMVKGQKKTLKLKGTKKKAKWGSSKKSVATVSSKGVVVGKKKGITVITAKVGSKKYTCKVTVETPKLNKKSVTLSVGKSSTLKVTGTKQKVKWISSNTAIATVSSKGVVTARKKGTAVITAKVGSEKYICKVTVKEKKKPTTTSSKYKKVVDYITNHGKLNSNYNYFISIEKKSSDTTYAAAIEYDEDIKALNLILISSMEFELGSGKTALEVTINNNATSADVDYVWIYSHQYGTNAVEMEAIINPKTYSGLSDINFREVSNTGNLSYKNINGQANSTLKVGFDMWQSLLEKKIGVKLKDIGFTAYVE